MGNSRPRPERLAEKLRQIRSAFGLSQTQMLRRLGAGEDIAYTRISAYELGTNEPTLMILLQYARVAGVPMEVLVDDDLDLPERLPGTAKHEEIKRNFASHRTSKRRATK
ncbi:MAG: helix-turn-helix domain-containing protein [Pyrinomonadaceae bacterium]